MIKKIRRQFKYKSETNNEVSTLILDEPNNETIYKNNGNI